ncbi:MAG TPA: hypothetical protein VHJ76_05330 [Actinomycetota bacterium]|nr:hypothetical protein [Actinomycetota bacterium]
MKKLGGLIVAGCLLAALTGGPAAASTIPSPGAERVPCEAIFSETVCDALGDASGTVRDVIDKVPGSVDEIRYLILHLADCVVHQTCIVLPPGPWTRDAADGLVCREVFSDAVCDRIENPVGTVQYVYDTFIRCLLDPECTPTPTICIGPPSKPFVCLKP